MQEKQQNTRDWFANGCLVAFPAAGGRKIRRLDGFYRPGPNKKVPLIVFVHGMGSNFYRSFLKKAFIEAASALGLGLLTFNNRGADQGTENEIFSNCLQDLDAAAAFIRRQGYRRMVFIGHSTGCQKIVYWHARRQNPAVAGLVLLAPADDYAVMRRDLGSRFDPKVAWAREKVACGRGGTPVQGLYERFSAKRFLSLVDNRAVEANVFRYDGSLTQFRRVKVPLLAVFGEKEEFAAVPPADMLATLRQRTKSRDFTDMLVPRANHSFKHCENELALTVCEWVREAPQCD